MNKINLTTETTEEFVLFNHHHNPYEKTEFIEPPNSTPNYSHTEPQRARRKDISFR